VDPPAHPGYQRTTRISQLNLSAQVRNSAATPSAAFAAIASSRQPSSTIRLSRISGSAGATSIYSATA
jgi:hypothetical protein